MNYEEMSDYKINEMVLVATMTNGECHDGDEKVYAIDGYNRMRLVDYCNNPSDAWPIVLQNKITISPTSNICNDNGECVYDGAWIASSMFIGGGTFYNSPCHSSVDQNPLRAAIIVFLMMKDEQNV